MTTRKDQYRWSGRVKWLVAFAVLSAVVAAGCDNRCRPVVAAGVVEGMAIGVIIGLYAVGTRATGVRRPEAALTLRRAWVMVRKEAHTSTAVGLLAGLVKAALHLLGG